MCVCVYIYIYIYIYTHTLKKKFRKMCHTSLTVRTFLGAFAKLQKEGY